MAEVGYATGTQSPVADRTGERVDIFLARTYPEYSRSFFQKLCKQAQVCKLQNGAASTPLDASHKLRAGDALVVFLPEARAASPLPQLEVLYEDDDVIVINKPAGILTHAKGAVATEQTVADFVRPRMSVVSATNRPGIVHRLDRGTSGVIIAAKHPDAQAWLQGQFSQRKVKKNYIALVKGRPKEPAAVIKLPIERSPKKPQTFRVGSNGKSAETAYETLKTFTNATLLKLMPRTGRTHQLRVHMHYIGTPIVGDELYGTHEPALGRMFLHAQSLELTLPSRERKIFTAPLPNELQKYLDSLQ